MFPFLRKKSLVERVALIGAVLVLLTSFFFVSCIDPVDGDDAQQPSITAQPVGGNWDVFTTDTFSLTVTATSPDSGTLSYQWYSNTSANNSGGSRMSGKTAKTLNLAKANFTENGSYYFYVVVTNTNNSVSGTKTATTISNVTTITVSGNVVPAGIQITSQTDMEKIGVEGTHPLNGTYVLMNNITLNNWSPIGDAETPFTGKFHGYGKTITLNSFNATAVSGKTYLGIFGYVKGASSSAKAEIKNLAIASSVNASSTAASQAIGLLTGYAELAEIDHITLSGTFTFDSTRAIVLGGIAGYINQTGTIIKDCNSSMTMNIAPGNGSGILTYSYVGGSVGMFRNGAGIENCHNSGNVTAVSAVSASQVFVGGITGGSWYAMSNVYHGYIQDCSFTGDILGKAMGFWTFAGGIAATIVGGTTASLESTTRIERCFATGTISVAGTSSSNPYIGGIVGYNYFGALTSQSYFTGTVIADKAGDYTGGIAGYNSQTDAPNNSRIEDCWSSGEVRGYANAGGIVGQNQVNTYIRRCYSTSKVTVTYRATTGVGGIAGMNASNQTDAITACVALNPSLSSAGTGNNINRVTGTTGGNRSNNHAWSGMPITTGGTYTERKGLTEADGADCAEKPAQSFYSGLGWNFTNVWKMGSDGYPKLNWQ